MLILLIKNNGLIFYNEFHFYFLGVISTAALRTFYKFARMLWTTASRMYMEML